MTGLLRYARKDMAALAQNASHKLAANHALVHYASGAVYSFIPKNACSTLRYSLAMANHCIAGPEDWVWIHANNGTFASTLPDLVRAPFSFVVLRCPHARLASVFLDKIVDKSPELWPLHRATREGFVPDDLTFRSFVGLISNDQVLLISNIHWRPQVDFLVYETYSQVFALEKFSAALPILRDEIGLQVQDARSLTSHGTDRMSLVETGDFADMPLHELAAMKREGRLPSHARLYDAALQKTVSDLYAEDLALYAAWLDPDLLTFPYSSSSDEKAVS